MFLHVRILFSLTPAILLFAWNISSPWLLLLFPPSSCPVSGVWRILLVPACVFITSSKINVTLHVSQISRVPSGPWSHGWLMALMQRGQNCLGSPAPDKAWRSQCFFLRTFVISVRWICFLWFCSASVVWWRQSQTEWKDQTGRVSSTLCLMTCSGSIVQFPKSWFWVRSYSSLENTDRKQCQKSQRRLFKFVEAVEDETGGRKDRLEEIFEERWWSTSYINGKSFAFKEAEFIDWWAASPCTERGDARTGVTQVKSYSSFVWASWQLICYLIGDERMGKIQATGRQCSTDLAAHANHQHCNWWHKSQQAAASSALCKTPGVVYPCQPPNENILACWTWEITKPPSRSSVCVLTPDHSAVWGWAERKSTETRTWTWWRRRPGLELDQGQRTSGYCSFETD